MVGLWFMFDDEKQSSGYMSIETEKTNTNPES